MTDTQDSDGLKQASDASAQLDALRDIIAVIGASRDDEAPVFAAILAWAEKLCGADGSGLQLLNPAGTHLEIAAIGDSSDWQGSFPVGTAFDLTLPTAMCVAVREARVEHIPDMRETTLYKEGYPGRRKLVDEDGVLAHLCVPLLQAGVAIGNITLSRKEARAFSPSEIALVETFAANAVIAIENARQFRELQTRLEREGASSEILETISQNRDDEGPVFEAILSNASHLCNAPIAGLIMVDDDRKKYRLRASRGAKPEFVEALEKNPPDLDPERFAAARAMVEKRIVHIDDLAAPDLYGADDKHRIKTTQLEGIRTVLFVPLIREEQSIGSIGLWRREVKPFSEDEIALVETFAAQAMIAIENVRQFGELQTQLAHQAATSEILSVISQSPDDETPVFEAILSNARQLCDAPLARLNLGRKEDATLELVAISGWDEAYIEEYNAETLPMDPGKSVSAQAIFEGRVLHYPDTMLSQAYEDGFHHMRHLVDEGGIRALLVVPLMQGGEAIGTIGLQRREAGAFKPSQIELVKSFAAQAVIAIENVRQFREVQERLERERASSEILQVISQSRDDDTPVFKTIVENAARLCNAPMTFLVLIKEDHSQWKVSAATGDATSMMQVGNVFDVGQEFAPYQSIKTRRIVEEPDVRETDFYKSRHPDAIKLVDEDGIRSRVFVPLVSGGKSLGNLVLLRREVGHFAPEDLLLVETFAAQAVIAIENVLQFREIQTRLERETATSEVLSIISQSRDDEQPVFDTILSKAAELCSANQASLQLSNAERTHFGVAAYWGFEETAFQVGGSAPLDSGRPIPQVISTGCSMNIADLSETDHYREKDPIITHVVDIEGIRSWLIVPLIKDEQAIGAIALSRREVKSFNESEIALVETFAAQAVIAIENVRQFREVQERLEREAASREVLGVISRSRDDERPVFDAILENASRLCKAPLAFLPMANAERTHVTVPAFLGVRPDFAEALGEFNEPLGDSGLVAVRAIAEARIIQSADLVNDPEFPATGRWRHELVETEGARSVLLVPMMQGGIAIGAIMLYRREIAPFSEDDVQLVKTFAEQAVIAIENVRQFKALEGLNAELGDRVEEQVGEIERMGRLKRFLPAAVADTVVSQGSDNLLKSHRALLGVLFCDIRGFTAFCETAEPEETIEVLQSYHEEMGALIAEHGAGVDTRAGDGIMVLFNDPLPCDDPAGDALRLGLAMRERMAELSKKWRRHGHRLGFGVGISLGYATVGMVGSAGRFDYTASGTAVNLAARLCDQANDGEILLSPRAYTAVEDDFDADSVGELNLKGIHAPVEVFRVRTEG